MTSQISESIKNAYYYLLVMKILHFCRIVSYIVYKKILVPQGLEDEHVGGQEDTANDGSSYQVGTGIAKF